MTNTKLEQVRYYLERLYNRKRFGKSTDTKPTDGVVGDSFTEVDTGDFYVFDGTDWLLKMSAIWTV